MIYLTLLLLTIYLPDFDSGRSEETDPIFELQATGGTESNRDHSQPLKEKEKCQYKAVTMQSSSYHIKLTFILQISRLNNWHSMRTQDLTALTSLCLLNVPKVRRKTVLKLMWRLSPKMMTARRNQQRRSPRKAA